MKLEFHKYVSIGNDFVLLENEEVRKLFPDEPYAMLAEKLCNRHFGVGSDGLLTWEMVDDKVHMRMFNPDGTEDFCGNGLRCAALHTNRRLKTENRKPFTMVHGGRELQVNFGIANWIDVQLPVPDYSEQGVPLKQGTGEVFEREVVIANERLNLCSVSVGSTHTIVLRESPPSEELFQKVSSKLEHYEWFPQRTSVIWLWPETKYNEIRIRIWERGVGETLGCGTGSAAAAACWFRIHPLAAVAVQNPGGECAVSKGPEGTIIASARAKHVYSGTALAV